MELSSDLETLSLWLTQYGDFALFGLLVLGIIAFPIPEETLMVLAGILMYSGKLNIGSTLISAYAGSIVGITISYLVGRTAGHYILLKYGGWIGFTQSRIEYAHSWFERFGTWVLLIGYFIPGIRHFSGFCAGSTELNYKTFALFAYTGAILWVSTFLSIGYFFGGYWLSIFDMFERVEIGVDEVILAVLIVVTLFVLYKIYYKKQS